MPPFPNSQANPKSAVPVWIAPPVPGSGFTTENINTEADTQVKAGGGTFIGMMVNTAGTASSAKLYDGTSHVVTITIANPGVISWPNHPFQAGDAVFLSNAGGALPTGLTAGTIAFVSTVGLTDHSFSVADTKAHALAGTNTIVTSGVQSGVHTAWDATVPLGTFDTTAVGPLFPGPGWPFTDGLIIVTAGSGPADLTVSFF